MRNRLDAPNAFRTILTSICFLMLLLVTGFGISCQSQAPAPSAPSPGAPQTAPSPLKVAIQGFAFKPAEITVPVGSTVTWSNQDSVIHTVTAQNRMFDSGSLPNGGTFSYTFKQKGTFEYHCIPHSYMKGKVVVE